MREKELCGMQSWRPREIRGNWGTCGKYKKRRDSGNGRQMENCEIETNGVENRNEDNENIGNEEDKVTWVEEADEKAGIRRGKRKKLRIHVILMKIWLIQSWRNKIYQKDIQQNMEIPSK